MTPQTHAPSRPLVDRSTSWTARAARAVEQTVASALRLVRGAQTEAHAGDDDARRARQARAFFVALSRDSSFRAAVEATGIRTFLKQADTKTDAAFDRLWRQPFAGRRVLEVGFRSRVRTAVFDQSMITCLDPFFVAGRPNDAPADRPANIAATYAVPAERFVPALAGSQHLALCWNLLDHCGNWRRVLDHITTYLQPGGRLILGVDGDVREGGPIPVLDGGRRVVAWATHLGLQLDYELPAAALARDWAGVFIKREGERS